MKGYAFCIIHQAVCSRVVGALKMPGLEKRHKNEKKGMDKKERATWTLSVSAKVNITDIPPGTLAYRDQRS